MDTSLRPFYGAWQKARRHKKPSMNQLAFEADWLEGLFDIREQVLNHRWQPRRTVCFITTHPKTREIHAPDFADRVVHHYLVPPLQALFEPVFIHDSFANRTGKGSHQAVSRLQQFMRQLPHSHAKPAYYLQLDIHNFFNSLDRRVLYQQLCHQLDKGLERKAITLPLHHVIKRLCHALVNQKPTDKTLYRGTRQEHALMPPHKQLKNARPGCGIAVGNLSSQFFANVYMNALDQWVKHTLKAKYYLRYVDDFVLLHEDPGQLLRWRQALEAFLHKQLGLRLKTNAQGQRPQPQPLGNGCDFLGYVVYPRHRVVRRRVIAHCRDKLRQWQLTAIRTQQQGMSICLNAFNTQLIQGLVASYWGHFHHASHWQLTNRIVNEFFWLSWLFRFSAIHPPMKRWHNKTAGYFSEQVDFFQYQYPDCQLLIQKGFEQISITPKKPAKARVTIQETGFLRSGIKCREVTEIFIPHSSNYEHQGVST